ncbi:MAG: DUF2541 family protein [Proteobacteria bacterium]|nr:MAG: DUF2541 family protein [Pseudomonadota bacterium]
MPKIYTALLALILLVPFNSRAAEPREEIIPLGTDEGAPVAKRLSSGAGPRVELLGQLRLSNRMGLTKVDIASCNRNGRRLTGLRLRILNSPATIEQVTVRFGNQESKLYSLSRSYLPNSDTGWIGFSGAGGLNPCVVALVIAGQNANLTPDSAVVQVFGLNAPAASPRINAKRNPRSPTNLSPNRMAANQ